MVVMFEKFCNEKGLKINVGKTKAMQINMAVDFTCNKLPIENVDEFKYLGLVNIFKNFINNKLIWSI